MIADVTVLDGTPAMADVLSGHEPEPQPWDGKEHYDDWALRTPALRRLCAYLQITIAHTGACGACGGGHYALLNSISGGGQARPYHEPVVADVLSAVGNGGGVVSIARFTDGDSPRGLGPRTYVALNVDGTRAAYSQAEARTFAEAAR